MSKIKNSLKDLLPAIILAFVTSFMLFIYEPILTYSANINDFWFDFQLMLPNILIYFLLAFVSITLGYILIYLLNRLFSKKLKVFKILLIISFIVFIFTYIQGNYLVGSLPTLDGTTINWNEFEKENIISLVVALILIIAEIILVLRLKFDKTLKINKFILIAVFLMLLVSLISRLTVPGMFKEKTVAVATNRNINKASSEKNMFIFLVDAVDSTEFSKIVDEDKEYEHTFDDFTYYPDTVCGYEFTRDAIPFVLSGEWNENKTEFTEYYNNAFDKSKLLKDLKDKDYEMNFYEYQTYLNKKNAEEFSNVDIYNDNINQTKFFKQLSKYILFKYLPYKLKEFSKIESANFDACKNEIKEGNYYEWNNDKAYETITNNEIELVDNKYFQFMHIEGGHTPFDYDENLNRIPEGTGTYQQKLKASLKIVKAFIDRLKQNNVYDNSVIIVMADHGYWATTGRQNPILYIKGINEKHEMEVSNVPVSHEDLKDAYIELLNDKESSELFQNIDSNRVRRFILNDFGGEDEMIEYEQRGKAWDSSATFETGKKLIREETVN